MTPVTPCLWFFSDDAEAAMTRYVELFSAYGPASVVEVSRYGPDMPLPEGSVLTMTVDLHGRPLMAINGGPAGFSHSPAASLLVTCASQEEVDHYWYGLLEGGGEESMCGWLVDRWGISWQVVPSRLSELLGGSDAEACARVTRAMLGMRRLDIAALEDAGTRRG
jgi:predicted 3-demethylubiquinone-9 3-methyltransferase (glyoxalase superfamily)